MDYLQQHKDTLIPEFRKVWEAAGFKTSGTWEEVFGKGTGTDGIFMAWNYARYIGRVVEAGKAEYPLPMYVNARAVRNCEDAEPNAHSGGPHARRDGRLESRGAANRYALARHLQRPTSWRFAQSTPNPATRCSSRDRGGDMEARVLYVFGRHDAIGLSLMGVERAATPDPN